MSAVNIDTERVITEVRGQPSLWDPSDNLYKDRDAKLQAWTEVCRALFSSYDDLPNKEKKEIERYVQLRWRTARDAYMKCKNALNSVKSGSGGGKKSKYVYFEHMQFLNKKHIVETVHSIDDTISSKDETKDTEETCNDPVSIGSICYQSQFPSTSLENSSNPTPPTTVSRNKTRIKTNLQKRKKRIDHSYEKEMLKFFKENSAMIKNDDMAFFCSLLPITKSFDIRQKLLFRSEILRYAMEISNSTAAYFPSLYDHNYISSRPGSSTSTCTPYIISSPTSQQVEESESQAQVHKQQYSP